MAEDQKNTNGGRSDDRRRAPGGAGRSQGQRRGSGTPRGNRAGHGPARGQGARTRRQDSEDRPRRAGAQQADRRHAGEKERRQRAGGDFERTGGNAGRSRRDDGRRPESFSDDRRGNRRDDRHGGGRDSRSGAGKRDSARDARPARDGRPAGAGGKGPRGGKPFAAKGAGKPYGPGAKDAGRTFKKDAEGADAEATKQGWTPKRERTVKSKKAFDQERAAKLAEVQETIYRGELDPRKKDEDSPKREKTVLAADMEENIERYTRADESSDFRDLFEKCEASPARLGALYVTRSVRKRGAYAQELIETAIDNSHMSAQDRSFATLLVLGVVSTWGTLDDIINRALQSPRDITPDVRDSLRISTYEIIMLGKAPHAALDQGVELVRAVAPSASRLGNAVLHRIYAMKDDFPFGDPKTDVDALARKFAFPSWMARKLIEDLGPQPASALMTASNDPAPLYIAVNALKATDDEVVNAFAECGATLAPASAGGLEPAGCYAVSNPRVLADGRIRLLFGQGKIIVSDASAQAVASALFESGDPGSVLEVGAGRGTKTILIQSNAQRTLGRQVPLKSMDSHAFKSELLAQRAKEYGVQIDQIVTGNATRLESSVGEELFDTVFIDAPCSGLGTLRRHQEIRWRMAPEHIADLVATQLGMLKSAASHVKPGGCIVYATCTVTYDENNGVVKAFLESDEGGDFVLSPIGGKACFASQLAPNAPDAHFAAKFIRKSQGIG